MQDKRISSRAAENLFQSTSGDLNLFFQRWQSDRHDHVKAVVFVHHGEMDHCMWYNGLAVRLAQVGCTTFAPDAQGFGQSDGDRGYFEHFEDLVTDFVEFCKKKWVEVLNKQAKGNRAKMPGLVFVGKGFGALVVMHALVELHQTMCEWGVMPTVVLVSPAFEFSSYIADQNGAACGLPTSGQCARQPIAQCARIPAVAVPDVNGDGPNAKLEHMSKWFPKMITTQPVDPELVTRDCEVVDRMNRDVLCWHSGYRARVLAEVAREMSQMADNISLHPEVFERVPALILHGNCDGLFSTSGSHSIHSIWCDAAQQTGNYPRLKIYDGAFHQLLNEPNKEEVVNDIVMFIASKALH